MTHDIAGVINATIRLVQEKLKAKYGSLEDCCTDANEMIFEALKDGIELVDVFTYPDLERMVGVVRFDDQEIRHEIRHEWISINGELFDATAEQFGDVKLEYVGEVADW